MIENTMPTREGVLLQANVLPFEVHGTKDPVLAIALHVEHEANKSGRTPATETEQVQVITAVFTITGHAIGTLKQTLAVTPQIGARGAAYDLLQRLPAKPGEYELRIGVHNETRDQTGSVHAFVNVPAFDKVGFGLSEIAVYAPIGQPAMKDNLTDVLLAPATARREFDRRERATTFARVYQHGDGLPKDVAIVARIVDVHDRKWFEQQSVVSAADFALKKSTDIAVNLPVDELDSGSYLLTIEARLGQASARRDLRFAVR
jgi:hypothetical protein